MNKASLIFISLILLPPLLATADNNLTLSDFTRFLKLGATTEGKNSKGHNCTVSLTTLGSNPVDIQIQVNDLVDELNGFEENYLDGYPVAERRVTDKSLFIKSDGFSEYHGSQLTTKLEFTTSGNSTKIQYRQFSYGIPLYHPDCTIPSLH